MASETLRTELHEAKDHAKLAARSTLLAVRSAIDFAITRLGPDQEQSTTAADAPEATEATQSTTQDERPVGSAS